MMQPFAETEMSAIEDSVRERFARAAVSPSGLFAYPTGRAGLTGLEYPRDILAKLPAAVLDGYCGVGNPFAPGLPKSGETVLDVGCGAGVDALVAALCVGPEGRVEGLEFSPEMLARARENAAAAGVANVTFRDGGAEALPYGEAVFDLLVSNGVYNLVLRKRQALSEALRVLKPGGRLQVADQVAVDDSGPGLSLQPASPADWAG